MHKKMELIYGVAVYVSDENNVCIKQEYPNDDESIIILHPNQVDTVIKWLKEAKDELENESSEQ
jgi:hypothetical protein